MTGAMTGTMTGTGLAAAAERLVGVPFRLHGRDPATGLDCIGVLAAALAAIGGTPRLPTGYALRTFRVENLRAIATDCGLGRAIGPTEPGDVLLVRPAACQLHLMIAASPDRLIHAHAGRGRVIAGPLPAHWPIAGRWRLAASQSLMTMD